MFKNKSCRLLILGQSGCGKTAFCVRYVTRRFIERKYCAPTTIDGENITMELQDFAHTKNADDDSARVTDYVRSADGVILLFSVTDRCSFDDVIRQKVLVNYAKRSGGAAARGLPCVLVGNQNDLEHERMVAIANARRRAQELDCCAYFDISVREAVTDPSRVVEYLYRRVRTTKRRYWYRSKTYKSHVTSEEKSPQSPRGRYEAMVSKSPDEPPPLNTGCRAGSEDWLRPEQSLGSRLWRMMKGRSSSRESSREDSLDSEASP